MKLKPMYNAVIVKPIEQTESKYGSIIVPDTGKESSKKGEVVGVGPGYHVPGVGFVENQLKEGDIVILPSMGFTKFEYGDEEYWIGPENQVLSTIINDENE
jgi:chaperonin GroES